MTDYTVDDTDTDEQTTAPLDPPAEDAPSVAAPQLPASVSSISRDDATRILIVKQTRPTNQKAQRRALSDLEIDLRAAGWTGPIVQLPYGVALEDHLRTTLGWEPVGN